MDYVIITLVTATSARIIVSMTGYKAFATGTALVVTGFVLGAIYSNWAYDYWLVWVYPTPAERVEAALEHYRIKASQPLFLHHVLHAVLAIGTLMFIGKLYKPTESNTLFDGGSLVLFVIGIVFYLTNLRPAARSLITGDWVDIDPETGVKFVSATEMIIVLAMLGVLALQFGQWWAEMSVPALPPQLSSEQIAVTETIEIEEYDEPKRAAKSSGSSKGKATKRK